MAVYSDINQGEDTSQRNLVYDMDSIYQALDNLLSTNITERFFNREYGADISSYLFEPMTEEAALKIFTAVIDAISRWEPRVFLLTGLSSVEPDYDNHLYKVRLVFQVKGLEDQKFEYERYMGA